MTRLSNIQRIFPTSHKKTGITSLSRWTERQGIKTKIRTDIGNLATLQKLRWFCCCSENCHFTNFAIVFWFFSSTVKKIEHKKSNHELKLSKFEYFLHFFWAYWQKKRVKNVLEECEKSSWSRWFHTRHCRSPSWSRSCSCRSQSQNGSHSHSYTESLSLSLSMSLQNVTHTQTLQIELKRQWSSQRRHRLAAS